MNLLFHTRKGTWCKCRFRSVSGYNLILLHRIINKLKLLILYLVTDMIGLPLLKETKFSFKYQFMWNAMWGYCYVIWIVIKLSDSIFCTRKRWLNASSFYEILLQFQFHRLYHNETIKKSIKLLIYVHMDNCFKERVCSWINIKLRSVKYMRRQRLEQ